MTTSVGLASYPEDAEVTEAHMLTYFADQALLAAKQLGRDREVSFSDLDGGLRHVLRRQFLAAAPERLAASQASAVVDDGRR